MIHTLTGHHNSINNVAFSPNNSKIISRNYDKTIKIWDALSGHHYSVMSVAFSPDSSKIISGWRKNMQAYFS